MNENGKFKRLVRCATCGALIVVYAGSAIGGAFAERHDCRNIKADASCREQSDSAPNYEPYSGNFAARIVVTTSGTSTASAGETLQAIFPLRP